MDDTTTFDARPIDSSQVHSAGRHLVDRSLNESPLQVDFSEGNYLYLSNDQMIFDATGGAAVACLGHGDQEVIQAITDQLWVNTYCNSMVFTTKVATLLADEIISGTGNLMSRATEAAMKMARQYFMELSPLQPQRTKYIAREHSYHGNTLGALALSGHLGRRETYCPILSDNISWVSACNPYRQRLPYESDPDFVARKAIEIDAEFQRLGPDTVIGFVCELISGAALGCIPYVHGYLPAMKTVCRKYGALFILDETMCGMGRSGDLHAWQGEHVDGDLGQDCLPDLQMIGKGLGGGYQPIAGVIIGKEVIAVVGSGTGGFIHGQTYQAHPVACAASLAVQRIIRREGLLPNVQKQGVYLSQLLQNKLGSHRNVGDIRGKGLFWGIEFVQNKETKVPFRKALNVASKISEMALKDFKITLYPGQGTENGVDGDHVLVAPAYIITGDAVDYIVHQLVLTVDTFFSRQAWESELGGVLENEPEGVRPDTRLEEVQHVQDALRNSKKAQEAISTLMDGRLHWSLNPTISETIFRVASIYRMLIEEKPTANGIEPLVRGCHPEWAVDVMKEVYETEVFDARCYRLPFSILLTDLPESICNAFGHLISITLLAIENKEVDIRKSAMLGVLEESEEWLGAEQGTNIPCTKFRARSNLSILESYPLWRDYEELITELDIDDQMNRLEKLALRVANEGKEIDNREKQLVTEKEILQCATQDLQQDKNFLFEWKHVRFKKSQLEILEQRLDIQKNLQDIRKEEYGHTELRCKKIKECIKRQQGLCVRQGVMDDNGHFKQPRKGSDCPANSE
ncbi:hypothetical protein ACLOAV_009887 [Pseudogymnoascus australis]